MALPTVASPKTTVTTPSGKKLRMRPFVGREEKALLAAKMTNDRREIAIASVEVIESSVGESIQDLPLYDLETLFMNAYSISVDGVIKASLSCKNPDCDDVSEHNFDLERVKLPNKVENFELDVGTNAEGDPIKLVISPPKIRTIMIEGDVEVIYDCLEGIYEGDEKFVPENFEEFQEWIMGITGAYLRCLKYIKDIPKISVKYEWPCIKCKTTNKMEVEGFNSFFV